MSDNDRENNRRITAAQIGEMYASQSAALTAARKQSQSLREEGLWRLVFGKQPFRSSSEGVLSTLGGLPTGAGSMLAGPTFAGMASKQNQTVEAEKPKQ